MKYKSIILNNDENYQISFIKYNEEYKEYLEDLEKLNKYLVKSVIECPKIFSELSDHQSYMILCNEEICIGAIYIGTSSDEKDLEIELHLNEDKFEDELGIFIVIDMIIALLGKYNSDKGNIRINLHNDIELSLYNEFKYERLYLFKDLNTYTCENEFYESQKLKLEQKD